MNGDETGRQAFERIKVSKTVKIGRDMIFQDRILKKIDNAIRDTVSSSKIRYVSFEEEGKVTEVNDNIVTATGFSNITSEECVIIADKYLGYVSIIDHSIIKIVLLNKTDGIEVGDRVRRTRKPLMIPVSDGLVGRVINALGQPLDNKNPIGAVKYLPIERPAARIIDRKPVSEPMQTGIKVIDALIPIGRGQRELILGDRQSGKTSLAINAILNQKDEDVLCIYCAIGQRDNAIARVIKTLEEADAMDYTIVLQAGSSEVAGHQFIAPYAATSIAEYFMEQGRHVLLIYDDLTKHARAYREISLLLGKNPGREAYPADIFYVHSRLLERSTNMKNELGGGSITSLPIIETEAENISAYIPTNVISITDGQIYLNPTMFRKGILPAVDVGASVSRVGSNAQLPAYKQAVGTLGVEYSQFEELESFSKFSTSVDDEADTMLKRGQRIREIFKQNIDRTFNAVEQIAIFLCLQNKIFDSVPLAKIAEAQEVAVRIMNENFGDMEEIIRSKKKIPQPMIDSFISRVKNNLGNLK